MPDSLEKIDQKRRITRFTLDQKRRITRFPLDQKRKITRFTLASSHLNWDQSNHHRRESRI